MDLKKRGNSNGASLALLMPLAAFIAVFFVIPIVVMLHQSVYSPEVSRGLPLTSEALKSWHGDSLPDDFYLALLRDLRNRQTRTERAEAARRLNYEIPGIRKLIMSTARALRSSSSEVASGAEAKKLLIETDRRWAEPRLWAVLARAANPYTLHYLTAAVDLRQDENGSIVAVDENRRIFIDVMFRTIIVSASITIVCLLLGYPYANFLANASGRLKAIGLMAVLLPFWTSLLVRTSAWIVVLQREGIVNWALSPLIDEPAELIFNRIGVFVVMVHVLMPFMVLPIYSTMKGVSRDYVKAATSLGASPARAFFHVYLKLTMPGVLSGAILTFIVAIGYYITPALVGGPNDQMIGYFIAFYTNMELNWGLASALSLYLFLTVTLLFAVLSRRVGLRAMMRGNA